MRETHVGTIRPIQAIVVLIAVCAIAAVAWAAENNVVQVTLDQVPAAVKTSILGQAQGAEIKEIEKETKDGKVVYTADVVKDGKETEIRVAADDKTTAKKADEKTIAKKADDDHKGDDAKQIKVALSDIPALVTATVEKEAKGGTSEEIEKETKAGKDVYSVDTLVDGKKTEVQMNAQGKVISRVVETDQKGEGNGKKNNGK
jgi:hypothetical protein